MDVIAERILVLAPDNVPVVVRIGRPFTPEGHPKEVWCPFQVEGIGSGKVRYSIGIDGIQAISLAFMRLGAELYSSEAFESGRLTFNTTSDLDLPVPQFLADIVPDRDSPGS